METDFGLFLKQKRQEKNLTQKQLAQILYVSESAVSKWEKGVAHPDITLLPKLSSTLGVTEHELITASIDNATREEKVQAKRWRVLSFSWSLFFYIAYSLAIIPCFICNLAINKTLSWFWIVVSALLLAFTFTNLPKLIKKHKLVLVPLSSYLALCVLLAVCCIYTQGNWFWIAAISVLLGFVCVLLPIYISRYSIFAKIKKFGDFASVFIDFAIINVLLIVIDNYTVSYGMATSHWYLEIALPIVITVWVIINILMAVRFISVNKLLKTSIILGIIDFIIFVIVPVCVKVDNPSVQYEIDGWNVFKADFSNWSIELPLERNVSCIVALTILILAVTFLIRGLLLSKKSKNTSSK